MVRTNSLQARRTISISEEAFRCLEHLSKVEGIDTKGDNGAKLIEHFIFKLADTLISVKIAEKVVNQEELDDEEKEFIKEHPGLF